MKIYTRTGDDGSTGLFGGDRVDKSHPRIRAYGAVDEANAVLGVALAQTEDDAGFASLRTRLLGIQHRLFDLGSDLATPLDSKAIVPRISQAHVDKLETEIDDMESELTPLKQFILPGGHPVAASLHVSRTTCRRAEREVVEAMMTETLNPLALNYLNRLSDYLFVAARLANRIAETPDVPWMTDATDE